MKKIFFLVVLCLCSIKGVNGLESEFINIKKENVNICDAAGNVYPVYKMDYKTNPMYFLNISNSYNTNFEDYKPILNYNLPKEITKYIEVDLQENSFYNLSVYLLLWNTIYPDNNFVLCSESLNDNPTFNKNIELIKNVANGPLKDKIIEIEEGETYIGNNPYHNYFERLDASSLVVENTDNGLFISGEKGIYELIYQRKGAGYQNGIPNLYSDGTNYLIIDTQITDERYRYEVLIGYKKVNINIVDEENIPIEGARVMIDEKEYYSSSDGSVSYYAENDNYNLMINHDGYNDYSDNLSSEEDIKITLIKKEDVFIEEEVIKEALENNENVSYIPLENTFALSLSFLSIGVLYLLYGKK